MKTTQLIAGACATLALLSASSSTQAAVAFDTNPELLFVLWDPVAKVSYTKDLGIRANDFWVSAQQDKGSQNLIYLDANPAQAGDKDTLLGEFLKVSTVTANQRWAVVGVASKTNSADASAGERRIFTTLTQGERNGVLNPNWSDMTAMSAADLRTSAAGVAWQLMYNLDVPKAADRPFNTHAGVFTDYVANGASFETEGSGGYFANGSNGFGAAGDASLGGKFAVTNEVGKSSWFYFLTDAAGNDKVAVDEFDNLGGNGYWGLASLSSSKYLLSYTMPAATPSALASSAEGLQRLSVTDFAAGFASRQIAVPADEFAALAVSAVPEASTWGSLGLGLLMLAAVRRRRQPR